MVFKARFGGVAREISVPIARVIAIYARENGQGMAFPAPSASTVEAEDAVSKTVISAIKPVVGLSTASAHQTQDNDDPSDPPKPPPPSAGSRPQLKRIK